MNGEVRKNPVAFTLQGFFMELLSRFELETSVLTKDALCRLSYSSAGDPEGARTLDL